MQTVTYLFDDYSTARMAIHQLLKAGISPSQITFVSGSPDDRDHTTVTIEEGSGVATGAAVGGMVGAGAGILTSIGVLAIPGFGPLVAAGMLATTLVTATGGIVAGGLIGALTGYGLDQKDAEVLAEGIRRGDTLISVRADGADTGLVEQLMQRHGGVTVATRRQYYTAAGWSGFDPAAPAFTREQIEHDRNRRRT